MKLVNKQWTLYVWSQHKRIEKSYISLNWGPQNWLQTLHGGVFLYPPAGTTASESKVGRNNRDVVHVSPFLNNACLAWFNVEQTESEWESLADKHSHLRDSTNVLVFDEISVFFSLSIFYSSRVHGLCRRLIRDPKYTLKCWRVGKNSRFNWGLNLWRFVLDRPKILDHSSLLDSLVCWKSSLYKIKIPISISYISI